MTPGQHKLKRTSAGSPNIATLIPRSCGIVVHLLQHAFMTFFAAEPFEDWAIISRCGLVKNNLTKRRFSDMPVCADAVLKFVLERKTKRPFLFSGQRFEEFTDTRFGGTG